MKMDLRVLFLLREEYNPLPVGRSWILTLAKEIYHFMR